MKSRVPYVAAALFLALAAIAGFRILFPAPEGTVKSTAGIPMATPLKTPELPIRSEPIIVHTNAPQERPRKTASGASPTPEARVVIAGSDAPFPRVWFGRAGGTGPESVVRDWKQLDLELDGQAIIGSVPSPGNADSIQILGIAVDEQSWYARRLTPEELTGDILLRPRPMTGVSLTIQSSSVGPYDLRIAVPGRESLPDNDLAANLRSLAFPEIAGALGESTPLSVPVLEPTRILMLDPWTQLEFVFSDKAMGNVTSMPISLTPGEIVERTIEIDKREGGPVDIHARLVAQEGGLPLPGLSLEHTTLPDRYRGTSDNEGNVLIEGFDVTLAPTFIVRAPDSATSENPPSAPKTSLVQISISPDQIDEGDVEVTIPVPVLRWLVIPEKLWNDRVTKGDSSFPTFAIQLMSDEEDVWLDLALGEVWKGSGRTALSVADSGIHRAVIWVSPLEYRYTEPTSEAGESPAPEAVLDGGVTPHIRDQRLTLQIGGKPAINASSVFATVALPQATPGQSYPVDREGRVNLGVVSEGPLNLRVQTFDKMLTTELLIDRDTPNDLLLNLDDSEVFRVAP